MCGPECEHLRRIEPYRHAPCACIAAVIDKALSGCSRNHNIPNRNVGFPGSPCVQPSNEELASWHGGV